MLERAAFKIKLLFYKQQTNKHVFTDWTIIPSLIGTVRIQNQTIVSLSQQDVPRGLTLSGRGGSNG